MPAIQPARLKQQVSELVEKFAQPDIFVRDLQTLLDLYSDHTYRPGLSGEPSPLISSYKTPPSVMRLVWQELTPLIKQQPAKILPLCDALWVTQNYDLQVLATRLLGQAPSKPTEPVIDRINTWICQGLNNRIMDKLFEFGLSRLRIDMPEVVFELISSWIAAKDLQVQQAGLRALLSKIDLSETENLPTIFRMLTPYLRSAPTRLRPDILAVLTELAHTSPSETAFLLRQNLSAPENPDTAWIVRKVLDEFPDELRAGLKYSLRENRQEVS